MSEPWSVERLDRALIDRIDELAKQGRTVVVSVDFYKLVMTEAGWSRRIIDKRFTEWEGTQVMRSEESMGWLIVRKPGDPVPGRSAEDDGDDELTTLSP